MTNEELAVQIQSGAEELTAELWNQCSAFIHQQASRYFNRNAELCQCEIDDLCQCGYFAVIAAVKTYKADAGCSFISWLDYYLQQQFQQCAGLRSLRQRNQSIFEKRALRFDAPITADDDDMMLADAVADERAEADFNAVDDAIYNEQLHSALDDYIGDVLTEKQADVIRARYWNSQTPAELSETSGTPRATIYRTEKDGLQKLRQNISTRKASRLQEFVNDRIGAYTRLTLGNFIATGERQTEFVALKRIALEDAGRRKYGLE